MPKIPNFMLQPIPAGRALRLELTDAGASGALVIAGGATFRDLFAGLLALVRPDDDEYETHIFEVRIPLRGSFDPEYPLVNTSFTMAWPGDYEDRDADQAELEDAALPTRFDFSADEAVSEHVRVGQHLALIYDAAGEQYWYFLRVTAVAADQETPYVIERSVEVPTPTA